MKGFDPKKNIKPLRPNAPAKSGDAKAELQLLRDKITDLVQKDPAKAATILSNWLNSTPAKTKKAG